jgi:predicted GH43/DUF377 family glycosyl hydrolase
MKKIYYSLLALVITGSITATQAPKTLNDLNQIIVSYHNNAFGVDHLFDQKIEDEKLSAWREVGAQVTQYVKSHCSDIFGTQDPVLTQALGIIEKANTALINAIETTYAIKDNTRNLIKMAATFLVIEKEMKSVIEKLKDTTFILKRKKNAQSLLINFALFIEITAAKANKDTRIGHRTDLSLPTTTTPPSADKSFIPLAPPTDLPAMYEEEPTETPPTRIPAIPTE